MARSTFKNVVSPLIANEDPTSVIDWMKEHRLLANTMKCGSCNMEMNWTKHSRCQDKYSWKCQTSDCRKYKARVSIRASSLFANSKLTLQTFPSSNLIEEAVGCVG